MTDTAQPFPEISAPFTHHKRDAEGRLISDGVINQIWLQLLIQLWNRTGGAGGASTLDALLYAVSAGEEGSAEALQNSSLAILIQDLVLREVAKFALDVEAIKARDPLEALLFLDASGSGSSEEAVDESWIPLVDGSEPPVFLTDGAGVLILVAYP